MKRKRKTKSKSKLKRRCKKCRCKPCLCKKQIHCYKITCGKKKTSGKRTKKKKKKYKSQKGGEPFGPTDLDDSPIPDNWEKDTEGNWKITFDGRSLTFSENEQPPERENELQTLFVYLIKNNVTEEYIKLLRYIFN